MNVRPRMLLLMVLMCVAVLPCAARAADRVLATFDGERIWLGQVTKPAKEALPSSLFYTRAYGSEVRYRLTVSLIARARALAPCPEGVAILGEDGQWVICWPDGQSVGVQPQDGATLLTLAGDGKTLWAIGVIAPGAKPLRAASTRLGEDDAFPTTRASIPTVATTSISSTQPAAPALYRLDRDRWNRVAELSASSDIRVDDVVLNVTAGVPTIGLRTERRMQLYSLVDGKVVEGGSLNVGEQTAISLMTSAGESRVVEAAERGVVIRDTKNGAIAFELDGAATVSAATVLIEPTAVRLFALSLDPKSKEALIVERSFSPTGVAAGAGASLPKIALPPNANLVDLVGLGMVICLTTLLVFAARKREPMSSKPLRKAGFRLAPLLPRLAAGVIDGAPFIVVLMFHRNHFSAIEPLSLPLLIAGDIWIWAALAVYLLHTGVSEWLCSRTLGKWLLGMRVMTTGAQRPPGRLILYRTLVRPIELLVPFSLLLIPLTLLRQRPGDITAGTVVVSAVRPGDDDDEDDGDEE